MKTSQVAGTPLKRDGVRGGNERNGYKRTEKSKDEPNDFEGEGKHSQAPSGYQALETPREGG
jgi:hypothetical protein